MKKILSLFALTLVAFMANAQSYTYDVNKDGMVSISDVTFLVNNILGVSNVGEDDQHFVYDVNGDGLANVTDVTCLVNKILGVLNPGEDTKPYLTCPDGNHPHLIDLGLPSGTMWSCCNVGAVKPEAYGDYYAWGETVVKDYYFWSSYTHCEGSKDTCLDLGGDIAFTGNDAAHVKWGGMWGMPTSSQIEELLGNCTSEWTTVNGVGGRRFTGPNGGTIFLPAAGRRVIRGISDLGNQGNYWSSNQSSDLYSAGELYFDSEEVSSKFYECHLGFTVRPIAIPLQLSTHALSLLIGSQGQGIVEITSGLGSYDVQSSDANVATAVMDGCSIVVAAVGAGTAIVTVTDRRSGETATIEVTVDYKSYLTCPDDHHPHLIDLGLPSGTKWACCNVDTNHPEKQSPEKYGGCYAWGEMEVKNSYSWENYTHCKGSSDTCKDIGSDIAGTEYDVAHVKWGGSWVMPSRKQQDELQLYCTSTWTTQNGVSGRLFTGTNGGSIFLPAAGYSFGSERHDTGLEGKYWSSTYYPSSSSDACYLGFDSDYTGWYESYRSLGLSVRPVVRNKVTVEYKSYLTCPDDHHPHLIDLGLSSGTKWACCNVDTDHPENQSPENYGGHYAWGETEVKNYYYWDSYTHDKDLGYDIAETEYDVAHVKWGGSWVMPSRKQQDELQLYCTSTWTTQNGVSGRLFTGTNGGSIFLPAAGYSFEYGRHDVGSYGFYWSSMRPTYFEGAYYLDFNSGEVDWWADESFIGQSVRPVVSN